MSREDLDRYDELAARLDRLAEAGKGSGPEADALRDDMDGPWERMTDDDREATKPPDHLGCFKALTLRIHQLDREGKGETPEADALREESDGPWRAMTKAEREEAARYSGDLDAGIEPTA
jgi:hypothetical protein